MNKDFEIIGYFSQIIIDTLQLDIKVNTPIFLSEMSIEHILDKHSDSAEYIKYISDIIKSPNYVSYRQKDKTVEFIRDFGDNEKIVIVVPVRPTSENEYLVRTLHRFDGIRLEKYIKKGKIYILTEEK